MKCIVETCGADAEFSGVCLFHRKREIEGRLVEIDDLLYDTCAEGHAWTPENTRLEKTNDKGGTRRRCRTCARLKAERKAREAGPPEVKPPPPYIPENENMRQAVVRFEQAIAVVDPKCKGNEEEYRDYTADTMPTAKEARVLCAGCPLVKMCDNYAHSMKPGWGLWGGRRWVYGRVYKDQKNMLHEED